GAVSDSQAEVVGPIRRRGRSLSVAAVQHEQAAHDEPAEQRERDGHTGHREHPDDVLKADVLGRLRLSDDLDDDRILLNREDGSDGNGRQEKARNHAVYSLLHASTASASSVSVRTATPVAPFG